MASEAVGIAISALIALDDLRSKNALNQQDVSAFNRLRDLLEDHMDQLRRNELDSNLRDSLGELICLISTQRSCPSLLPAQSGPGPVFRAAVCGM